MRVRLPALLWDLSATRPHPGGVFSLELLVQGIWPRFSKSWSNISYQNSQFSTAFFKPDLHMKLYSDS